MFPLVIGSALLGFAFGRLTNARKKKEVSASSPISGIAAEPWAAFVSSMAVADKHHVGRKGKLGAFQMDARRLADVGAMTRAWKGQRGPEVGAWMGEWVSGLTEEIFLGNLPVQYAVFSRSMRAAAPKVSPLVGKVVDGKVASLSGLLGVSHVAGERGVEGFVRDAAVRARFPSTATVFSRTNGIF
jgi:hypothetical protein